MDSLGEFEHDIQTIQSIEQVPRILDVCSNLTGMRFVTVARVTEDRWVTCAALDKLGFGLVPGGELPLASTICDEIRNHAPLSCLTMPARMRPSALTTPRKPMV